MNIRAAIFGGGVQEPLLRDKLAKKSDSKALTDIRVAREETRRSNGRDQDRFRLAGVTFPLTYAGREYQAEIVNLSGGGAMIAADILPNIGERLHIHLGEGGTIECAVRWVKGGRIGLEFAHETRLECSDDEQAALLRDVIQRDFPDEQFKAPASETPDPSEQRSDARHPLIWWGDLHHGSHSLHVRIRNISASGALVECAAPLRVGAGIVLDLAKAGTLTATVSWTVGDHAGLKFDEPFDLQRLSEAQPRITPPRWLRPDFLAQEVEAESPWDDAWNRLSVDDLKEQLEGFMKR